MIKYTQVINRLAQKSSMTVIAGQFKRKELIFMSKVTDEMDKVAEQIKMHDKKYNTKVTRKACLIIGIVAFMLGFLVKATIF